MNKTITKKLLSFIVCIVLITAMALMTCGCKGNTPDDLTSEFSSAEKAEEVLTLGEGETQFDFVVVHKDGTKKFYKIKTDDSIVGQALQDVNLIFGDDDQYGLYVKEVDGETLDYNKDGYWWAFYVGTEQAPKGVDQTEIESGKQYSFRAEKA